MPTQYKYKAVSADGRKHKGSVSVENRQQAIDFLGEQALIPIEVKSTKKKKHLSFWGFFSDRDYENLIMFTNNLATLFKAGIPVLKALTLIKIGPPQNRFNQIISQVKFQMQAGASLSKSMAEFDHVFSTVYTSSIAAGEESGKLDDILDDGNTDRLRLPETGIHRGGPLLG
jgi:general secretion pathway protein F